MAKIAVFFGLALLCLSCSESQQTLKIKGSDTEVNLVVELAEAYHHSNKNAFVSISGGGTGLGIAALLNGQTDIANASREINDEEKELFTKKGIGIDTFIFAEDAIAFVVSPDLPVDSLTTEDLARILDGSYSDWSAVSPLKMPINIYGRQSNSGTHEFVKKKLGIGFTVRAREMNGNAQIIEAIRSDRSGIGYVGAGYVTGSRVGGRSPVKVLKISASKNKPAYSPMDADAVFSHRYFFQRHLYQYILKRSAGAAEAFIAFERSPSGAELIKASGYYPVKRHSKS